MPRKAAKLHMQSGGSSILPYVELPWPGSLKLLRQQVQIWDAVMNLAQLPPPQEYTRILEASCRAKLPAIWRRAQASPLELLAASVLTALALSNRRERQQIISQLLNRYGWALNLPGRPRTNLATGDDIVHLRGREINHIVEKLRPGFQIKQGARRKGGFLGGDEQIADQLKEAGYPELLIEVLLEARTLQDAACRLYNRMPGKVHVSLRTIRNNYSAYKRRKERTNLA